MKRKFTCILLLLTMLLSAFSLTSCFGSEPEEGVVTRMTVDINPSVEFMIDDQNKVVSVTALNDDGGILIVAHAGEDHLLGLKRALYEETHRNTPRADLPKSMQAIDEMRVKYQITVEGSEAIANLFAMTPYYWRTSPTDAQKLAGLSHLTTEVDVLLTVYQKRGGAKE